MDVGAAALSRVDAASVVGEEFPMILLDVSIPVPARGEHEVDVTLEVIVSVVAAARDERLDEHLREL